jgi:hypothetical protein
VIMDSATPPILNSLRSSTMNRFILDEDIEQCAQAHCDQNDPVAAYRRFYCHDKSAFATWTQSAAPAWITSATTEALPS